MSRALTDVEKYLESKKLDYHLDGVNAMMLCPFCNTEEKFGINLNNWLYQCWRAKCGAKGNEKTFKRHFGDSVEESSNRSNFEDLVPEAKVQSKAEALPDVEAAHKALLEDDELLNWLNDERGLSIEVVKAAKLGLGKRNFGNGPVRALMFPYFENNKCVGVKYRSIPPQPKDFRYTAGRDVGLYRYDVIKKGMDTLLLCEGETDTLALVQQGVDNVIGVPGCKGKKIDWAGMLDRPKNLFLIFDNDGPGQAGAREFATRFGINRFYNVVLPAHPLDVPIEEKDGLRTTIKDVNEFFLSGHTMEEFNLLLEDAKPFDIEGVTTMDTAFDNIIKMYGERGTFAPKYLFKWPSVTARAKGINDGDLIVVLAAAKCGKTTACLNQAEFMAEEYGTNPHFDCMEMDGEDLTKKWAAMRLEVDEDTLTIEQVREARRIARSRAAQFNFTRSHPKNLDDYLNHLRQVKARYDSGLIVIDNFQILVDLTIGRNNTNNRPSYMSQVSKSLKALAAELRLPIFLISQPKGLQEDKPVTVNDSEGSSTLTKDSDLFFTFNRNPEVKMKLSQMDSIGNVETTQSHSDKMYVEVGLSRRSKGGVCTLRIDGAKSIIREYTSEESRDEKGGSPQFAGDMKFTETPAQI